MIGSILDLLNFKKGSDNLKIKIIKYTAAKVLNYQSLI